MCNSPFRCLKTRPTGRLFSVGSFLENRKSRPKFGAASYPLNICVLNLTKMDRAKFWAIFSQSHLGPML
jgi:hypothetical protein